MPELYTHLLSDEAQVEAEEEIAALIWGHPNNCFHEETAQELGRAILYRVLRQFRPDLFKDGPHVAVYDTEVHLFAGPDEDRDEIVMWESAEWESDPDVATAMVSATRMLFQQGAEALMESIQLPRSRREAMTGKTS